MQDRLDTRASHFFAASLIGVPVLMEGPLVEHLLLSVEYS